MTLTQLLAESRLILDDNNGSSTELLWGNSELVSYYNDALDKLMDKVWMLIPDSTTAEDLADTPLPLCELDIVAGTQIYDISSKIIKIRRIKISGQSRPLEEISYDSLISAYPNWEDETGTPQRFTLDYSRGSILLTPKPIENASAALSVYRRPLALLATTDMGDSPEIPEEYHRDLIPYVLFRCYMKNDTETMNKIKAMEYKQLADQAFDRVHRVELKKVPASVNAPMYGYL